VTIQWAGIVKTEQIKGRRKFTSLHQFQDGRALLKCIGHLKKRAFCEGCLFQLLFKEPLILRVRQRENGGKVTGIFLRNVFRSVDRRKGHGKSLAFLL
jgi:hypothetical protein